MKISDLLKADESLTEEADGVRIPISSLQKFGVDAPEEVVEQFFSDHGRNEYFQRKYGHIELNKICWQKTSVKSLNLINSSILPSFQKWVDSVSLRVNDFERESWRCIDTRREIVVHWEEHGTWIKPPIFLNGSFVSVENHYHLVEGHTRIGVLTGLINCGVLNPNDEHLIWYGSHKDLS